MPAGLHLNHLSAPNEDEGGCRTGLLLHAIRADSSINSMKCYPTVYGRCIAGK